MIDQTIDPKTLQGLRKRRGWSQAHFAKLISKSCTKDTVSRWERGQRRMRGAHKTRVAELLGVSIEALSRPLSSTDLPSEHDRLFGNSRLSVTIRNSHRNALWYVCDRYGVAEEDVIGLAPLMFMLLAETSLARRREEVGKIEAAIDEANEQLGKVAKYLQPLELLGIELQEVVDDERRLIAARKVFEGARGYDGQPFVRLLRALQRRVPEGIIDMIDDGPDYGLTGRALLECLGIEGKQAEDDDLGHWLRYGDIDLKEAIRQSRRGDEARFTQWLAEQVEGARQDANHVWKELGFGSLNIDLGDAT